jgi:malonyl CoA-acyl carrier protein transacylase
MNYTASNPQRNGGPVEHAARRRTAFVFSGQGTQSYFMAKELYDSRPSFQRCLGQLDDRFRALLGLSVLERVYDSRASKADPLDDILVSHPAIFMVEYALGQMLIEHGIKPDLVLGASLGELVGAVIAGAISVDEALPIVAAQAQLFDRARVRGGMIAVLHDIEIHQQLDVLARHGEIAAVNYDANFVVAGGEDGLAQIQAALSKRGIAFHRLPIRQPFHSSLIDHLRDDFQSRSHMATVVAPRIPLISCSTASVVKQLSFDHFWSVIRNPIRVRDTVRYLEAQGGCDYIDLGPAASFSTIIKRILTAESSSRIFQLLSPFSRSDKELDKVFRTIKPAADEVAKPAAPARKAAWEAHIGESTVPVIDATRAFLFPGQGSQERGMGAGLFTEFADLIAIADGILGYSIEKLCVEDPDKQLGQTQFTQPALYVVNALSYLKRLRAGKERPAFFAGHSLGEYNALLAAGAFDFETGLRLVKKRGELMSRASGGAMAAVINCDAADIEMVLRENQLTTLDIANFNAPNQIVISGPADAINQARPFFTARGAHYIPLNVSAPFHSRYMEPAAREFATYLQQFTYAPLRCTVISNVTAQPYENGSIAQNLTEQLRQSVRWTDSVRHLLNAGVQELEEIGPGRVLTKLVATIKRARN